MENIDYAIVIRTIGKAGEKYLKLLESIKKLVPQPQEIIVVLPEGYGKPTFIWITSNRYRIYIIL